MAIHWCQMIQYTRADGSLAIRPQTHTPVDGPYAPVHPSAEDSLRRAIADGLRNPAIVVVATLRQP